MEKRKYKVYIHEFPNGKVYVGITSESVYKRWGHNGYGYYGQPLMWNAIQKYGWNNIIHDVEAIDLSEEEAKRMEIDLISEYKSFDREYGYNISLGGESAYGFRHSDETKNRFHEQRVGVGNSFYGRHHTDKTKALISEANIGRNVGSNSPRAKAIYKIDLKTNEIIESFGSISEAADNESMRKHISDCCNGKRMSCYGFKWQYVNEPHEFVGNWSSLKSVNQINLENGCVIKTFKTMRDAVDELGVSQSAIKKCCDGKRKSTGGYGWAYYKGSDVCV